MCACCITAYIHKPIHPSIHACLHACMHAYIRICVYQDIQTGSTCGDLSTCHTLLDQAMPCHAMPIQYHDNTSTIQLPYHYYYRCRGHSHYHNHYHAMPYHTYLSFQSTALHCAAVHYIILIIFQYIPLH